MEESNANADQFESSREDGAASQEVGKVGSDLKGDGKETYGPWLLVKRKKVIGKTEHRIPNQGEGVGPGKGYSRNFKTPNRQAYKSRVKPTFRERHGPDRESKEIGHRESPSPSMVRERLKQFPFPTNQKLQST